jgi:hypothetical protein
MSAGLIALLGEGGKMTIKSVPNDCTATAELAQQLHKAVRAFEALL